MKILSLALISTSILGLSAAAYQDSYYDGDLHVREADTQFVLTVRDIADIVDQVLIRRSPGGDDGYESDAGGQFAAAGTGTKGAVRGWFQAANKKSKKGRKS